ncbi:MAG: DUF4097 family beta strand repeat protein [Phycisphaerae bacterium]|nr:DUF4097 family beta strand repeat protein [Gemmatimonadaceae bacterium]
MSARTRILTLFTAIGALLLHATPSVAQQAVTRGWPLNADGAIKIHSDVGTVRVIGWDRDSVAVTGTIANGGAMFGGGDRTGVKFGIEGKGAKNLTSSDLVVHVPARARVWIRSASATVDVSAYAGPLDVASVSGNVKIQGTPTEVRAESMNGTLDVTASPAYLRLKSATGAIAWNGSSEDVAIATVSGRLTVNAGTVQRGRFESIDGEVRYSGSIGANGSIAVDTHSGNVLLAFTKGTNVQLDVSARGCELFGVPMGQERMVKFPNPPKGFYKTLGKPSPVSPSFTVRTYKGYVTAVVQ